MIFQPVFFHVDLDAFFASVEQLDHSEYRGKPVIVAGDPSKRGVVSTCSYEARAFGVHSAMPTAKAKALCPQAIFVGGRMQRYQEKSREVMQVFSSFSPDVCQISIDEAFLDMSGTSRLFGDPRTAAHKLKEAVHAHTGLTVSVGIAANRYVAKIASGKSKPDGLTQVEPGDEALFISRLPLKDIWGIGEKTRQRLQDAGLPTVTSLLACPQNLLSALLGSSGGSYLYTVLRGIDPGIYSGETASRSISSEHTFEYDIYDTEILETFLLDLSSEVMYRLMDDGLSGKTVHLKIRYEDFRTVSIQETGDRAVNDTSDLFDRIRILFRKKYERGIPVRLLGVGIHNVTNTREPEQQDLFDTGASVKRRKVEEAMHKLSTRRGKKLVTKARLIDSPGARHNAVEGESP